MDLQGRGKQNNLRREKMIRTVNKMKTDAANKILAGDFSKAGAFLEDGEVENPFTPQYKILISNDEITKRAQAHLNK